MCLISDKIKLCTCSTEDLDKLRLKHFWILDRLVKGKNEMVVGMIAMPYPIDASINIHNQILLLEKLNEGNIFDKPMEFKQNDLLSITFTVAEYEYITYGFIYRNGKWLEKEYDPFVWMQHHNGIAGGKIRNPLNRRKRKNTETVQEFIFRE